MTVSLHRSSESTSSPRLPIYPDMSRLVKCRDFKLLNIVGAPSHNIDRVLNVWCFPELAATVSWMNGRSCKLAKHSHYPRHRTDSLELLVLYCRTPAARYLS